MRVLYASALHLEFWPLDVEARKADLVVLAGDIHARLNGIEWSRRIFQDIPVLYVLENHEYYGHASPRLLEKLRRKALGTSLHVLDHDSYEQDGVTFLGFTLWTDHQLLGDPWRAELEPRDTMTDYRRVRVSPQYRRLRPADTLRLHEKSRAWLAAALEGAPSGVKVVVTHHAPSARSLWLRSRSWGLSFPDHAWLRDDLRARVRRTSCRYDCARWFRVRSGHVLRKVSWHTMIDESKAVEIAKARACENGWPFSEPVETTRRVGWFGQHDRFEIETNAGKRGTKARFTIDAESGEVLFEGYIPR